MFEVHLHIRLQYQEEAHVGSQGAMAAKRFSTAEGALLQKEVMRGNLEMVGEKLQEEFCWVCKPVVTLEGDLNEKGIWEVQYAGETGENSIGR